MHDIQRATADPMSFGIPNLGSPPAPGALETQYDEDGQLMRIDCHGTWTPAQVDACFEKLRTYIA